VATLKIGGRVSGFVAVAIVLAALTTATAAQAHVTRLFPGRTILATKDDVQQGCSACKPKPSMIVVSYYNVIGYRLHWSGWGSPRAVGHGTIDSVARGLRGTITFVASGPRVVETAPECAQESGLASLREYTRLSFREQGIANSGNHFSQQSHSNLAYTKFPFDC
jgi:hypothetical protein